MRVIIQNVLSASVSIEDKIYSSINNGYLLLVSFTLKDNEEIAMKLANKILNLRIFKDENGKTNLNLHSVNGEILSVSQFTLYADYKHGNRPSFTKCLEPSRAKELYDFFNNYIKEMGYNVKTGVFGADIKVNLINDGPFTMVIDSEELL